jgi:hypothetical protein
MKTNISVVNQDGNVIEWFDSVEVAIAYAKNIREVRLQQFDKDYHYKVVLTMVLYQN